MGEKLLAIQARCTGTETVNCSWTGTKQPFGQPGEENEDQARLSAIMYTRLGHITETAARDEKGELRYHHVIYEIVCR